LALKELQRYAR